MTASGFRQLLVPIVLLCLPFAAGMSRAGSDVVGKKVYERLAFAPKVRVMILLSVPAADPARPQNFNLEDLIPEVSQAQDAVLGALGRREFNIKRRFQVIPALAGEITARGLERLESLPGVLRVDLDEGGMGALAQAVPLSHSSDVQALGYTGAGITVGILDSGLDRDHPDLADALAGEACFCSGVAGSVGCCPNGLDTQFGAGAAEDDHGHGSNVTGIVTSNGVVAPVGVAPDASVVVVKVLDKNNVFCCSSDVVAGLDWIIANRPDVDVINMSLGTSMLFGGNCDNFSSWTQAYSIAINTLRSRGVLSFAASYNTGSGTQMSAPACIANAISVGAVWDANVGGKTVLGCTDSTTAADKVCCFSNSNSETDMFAPGAPITSAGLNGGTTTFHGTSQACVHAAACVADLLQKDPTQDANTLEAILEATGPLVTDVTNGLSFPRVDCLAALNALPIASGRVPDGGGAGVPLAVVKAAGSDITLSWGDSCVTNDNDYEIYEGALGAYYTHAMKFCTTGGTTSMTFTPAPGSTYYLVVPRNAVREGSYGLSSDGLERPQGVPACVEQKVATVCQ